MVPKFCQEKRRIVETPFPKNNTKLVKKKLETTSFVLQKTRFFLIFIKTFKKLRKHQKD